MFRKNFLAPNTFRFLVDKSNCFSSVLFRDFAELGGSKSISMALVKTNPKNELGDIISDPCVELNRFWLINRIGFFILFRGLYRNGGSKFISMALVKTKPEKWVGRYHFKTLCRTQPFPSNKSNLFLHFCSEDFAGMAGLSSYLWALWRQIKQKVSEW